MWLRTVTLPTLLATVAYGASTARVHSGLAPTNDLATDSDGGVNVGLIFFLLFLFFGLIAGGYYYFYKKRKVPVERQGLRTNANFPSELVAPLPGSSTSSMVLPAFFGMWTNCR